ncbi:MAG: hypothetical protein FWD24_07845, partial [Treponema sp.]|nr:hypothetical protein [Treponema sp.]
MIVPMKKVCLMVQDKKREDALVKLREVGVVHLENKDAPIDVNSNAVKLKTKVEDAIGLISEYKVPKKKKPVKPKDEKQEIERRVKHVGLHRGRRATDIFGTDDEAPYSVEAVRAPIRPYLPDIILDMGEERKVYKENESNINREIARIKEWGDFNPATVKEIIEYGIPVYFYEMTPDVFSQIDENAVYIKIKSDKSIVRIIVFYEELTGLNHFVLPAKRLFEYEVSLEENKILLYEVQERLKGFADRRPALNRELEKVQEYLDFEIAVNGMHEVDDVPQEHKVAWLTGYIPHDEYHHVKTAAAKNNWALTVYDPSPDDAPPTKLIGNPVARLLHPLLYLLGTIPGYKEFDISPSYLFFFSIFFAMILGDAGYGALIFSFALLIGIGGKIKSGRFPDVSKLLMILTFCTVIWGAINGSWFAIPKEHLPVFLKMFIIPQLDTMNPIVTFPPFLQGIFMVPDVIVDKTQWNIQFLCFFLAIIQLVWARGKRILDDISKRSLTFVAQFGMLVMMIGLYFLVLNMLLSMQLPKFAPILIGIGAGLNLLFSEQRGGNFFANIGKGLGNAFQFFLKAVSCFADIISYIRLFAVGLAGSIIANIVND